MKNTHFMNSTGLPDAQHYSTAQDLYLLAAALIRDFPAEYGSTIRRRNSLQQHYAAEPQPAAVA